MTRVPLYFRRGFGQHGPGPYRRLLRSRNAAWRKTGQLEAEVINLSEELVLAKAAIQRVQDEPFAYVRPEENVPVTQAWRDGYNTALMAVHAALEGDSDDRTARGSRHAVDGIPT